MTREEAGTILRTLLMGLDSQSKEAKAIECAMVALYGPIPDLETGLVPCQGNKAYLRGGNNCWFVACPNLDIITLFFPFKDTAKRVWNTAMGYREE